jgi:hypothetical protein
MNQVLYITPEIFVASGGKLDSNNLYLFKDDSNPNFILTNSKTIKLTGSPIGFVQDIGNHHIYVGTDDTTFESSYTGLRYK